jgi:hypothetical protein
VADLFEPIELTWRGDPYVIPANRVLAAIDQVERVITLGELSAAGATGVLPLARLSRAYATLLNFAGCRVRNEEVYGALWTEDAGNSQAMVAMLINVMVPKKVREKLAAAAPAPAPTE